MIALGSDHGGLALKRHVMDYLDQHQLAYKDYGCYTSDSCDYPDFGRAAAEAVASGECDRGIVICTTGIGISITANKVRGVRCALCWNSRCRRRPKPPPRACSSIPPRTRARTRDWPRGRRPVNDLGTAGHGGGRGQSLAHP